MSLSIFRVRVQELTAGGILISVVLVWDCLFRSHISYTLSFLEELWSRNLGNLFVSPLRPSELIIALASISMMRTLIGMLPAALLVFLFFGVAVLIWDSLFLDFSESCSYRLGNFAIYGKILIRYGLGAEDCIGAPFSDRSFFMYLLSLSTLPDWMQSIAVFIPTTYVSKECVRCYWMEKC